MIMMVTMMIKKMPFPVNPNDCGYQMIECCPKANRKLLQKYLNLIQKKNHALGKDQGEMIKNPLLRPPMSLTSQQTRVFFIKAKEFELPQRNQPGHQNAERDRATSQQCVEVDPDELQDTHKTVLNIELIMYSKNECLGHTSAY